MCGICGTAGFADPHLIEHMTALLYHRGPDDGGTYVDPSGEVALGNRRLSIIDLSDAGHQPMGNEDGSVWITYNGEVYNFAALRGELQSAGHSFRSRTDTEVLVHGWEQWGTDLFVRLNGMFGLAIWDRRSRELILARDAFGQKPLYYTHLGNRLVFGSEIRALLAVPETRREVNLEALHRFVRFLWVPGPETLFAGIEKLAPGHYLRWREGRCTIERYWDLKYSPVEPTDEDELAARVREELAHAVERHMVADVPVGVFLSGGIDSSAILAFASQMGTRPVKAYTIGYRPEDGRLEHTESDAPYARQIAQKFGAELCEIEVSPDIVDLLPRVIDHLEEPVADPAAITTYLICAAARPDLKVLLSGQGGDEIFAGYRVYWYHAWAERVRRLPRPLRRGAANYLLDLLPSLSRIVPRLRPGYALAAQRYLRKMLEGVDLPADARYAFYRGYYADAEQMRLYAPRVADALAGVDAGARHLEYFAAVPGEHFTNRMLYVDAKTFLPELNLTYSDKMSAAVSVEVRLPLLDLELVRLLEMVPPRLKLRGTQSKYILKKALGNVLPHEILHRPKMGFGAPIRSWLRGELRGMVGDLLSEQTVRRRGYFNPREITRIVNEDYTGVRDHTFRIWAFLTLELWHQRYIDPSIGASGRPQPQAIVV